MNSNTKSDKTIVGNTFEAAKCLMGSDDEMKLEFPETKSCRSTWSFRNGIYLAETNQFFPHESPEIRQDKVPIMNFDQEFNVAAWKQYSEELENIRPVTGMSDLHNMPMPELMPLALIDRITDNQLDKARLDKYGLMLDDLTDEEKDALLEEEIARIKLVQYAYLGRCFFRLDELHTALFLLGASNSGKSTLLSYLAGVYPKEDVAVLQSTGQAMIDLRDDIPNDKKLIMCTEVKLLPQGLVENMITGERVALAKKFKESVTFLWSTPIIFAGNEIPNWKDTYGALARRFVVFRFVNQLTEFNSNLIEEMEQERADFILKCTLCYHKFKRMVGNQSVWNTFPDTRKGQHGSITGIMPKYYHLTHEHF